MAKKIDRRTRRVLVKTVLTRMKRKAHPKVTGFKKDFAIQNRPIIASIEAKLKAALA